MASHNPVVSALGSFFAWWKGFGREPEPKKAPKHRENDDNLFRLMVLVSGAASNAHMYAYATSQRLREWLAGSDSKGFSGFREKAEELSRPYPTLRPGLGRLYLALEHLAEQGGNGCLPPQTYGNVLFSDSNPCHAPRCEIQKLADQLREEILQLYVGR
jgi:hypothetical protein